MGPLLLTEEDMSQSPDFRLGSVSTTNPRKSEA